MRQLILSMLIFALPACSGSDLWHPAGSAYGLSSEKKISGFRINGRIGIIDGLNILVVVADSEDVTSLAPDIEYKGVSIFPPSGAAVNFSAPVSYAVTSEDRTVLNYIVTVEKESEVVSQALLTGISVSKGRLYYGVGGASSDVFSPTVYSYLAAPVPFSSQTVPAVSDPQSVVITATAQISTDTIKINGNDAVSGVSFNVNGLTVGSNEVLITVTSADLSVSKSYTVDMYRAVPVFKTGSSGLTSYVFTAGEDGNLNEGVNWPSPRFTDNSNGSVTDVMTGLDWIQNLNVDDSTIAWASAFSKIATQNSASSGGHSDWRLPNIREARSLINYGQNDNHIWLTANSFIFTASFGTWTGTGYSTKAISINLWTGDTELLDETSVSRYYTMTSGVSNIPVSGLTDTFQPDSDGVLRKGIKPPIVRFIDNGNGTLTDNMTGLMWEKLISNSPQAWSDILSQIATMNATGGRYGYADWRLANVNEMDTILDYTSSVSQTDTLISYGFLQAPSSSVWTGTTYATNTTKAWCIALNPIKMKSEDKDISCYYMIVRGPL